MSEADCMSTNSAVLFNPLKAESNVKALKTFEEIIRSSIGPYGHSKYVTHVEGGIGTLSSSSTRLLRSISFKNTILKLIVQSVNHHLIKFKNGGLVLILLILKLILCSIDSDMNLPLAGKLLEHYGMIFIKFLKSEQNECTFELDWSNLGQIKNLVETILLSKPQCCLSKDSLEHLTLLIIKTHLNSIPDSSGVYVQRKINYVTVTNDKPDQSKLLKGLLIKFPEVSKDLNYFPWTMEKQILQTCDVYKQDKIRTVLYSISLSGDADFPTDKLEVHDNVDVWQAVLKFLHSLAERIIAMNVHIFACQKVVHPTVRKLFEKADVLVLDRLGFETANNLKYLSGSSNSSFFGEISVGYVTDISIERLGEKNKDPMYLLLENKDKPFWTLVIQNYCRQATDETKIVCEQALDTLWRLLKKPTVCCGAGCLEYYTCQMVKRKVLEDLEELKRIHNCSSSKLLEALQIFEKSVLDIPAAINQTSALSLVAESGFNHLWKIRDRSFPLGHDKCLCGAKVVDKVCNPKWKFLNKAVGDFFLQAGSVESKSQDKAEQCVLLDELNCKISAYSVAFETASLLLRSTLCIQS